NILTVTVVRQTSRLVIALMNPEVETGSDVFVSATFNGKQDDPEPLTYSSNPNYRFEVRDGRGHLVKKIVSPPMQLLGMPYVVILDGKETRLPGKYTIQAFRPEDNPKGKQIESNVVTVTIQKPDLSTPPFTISVAAQNPEFKSGSNVWLQVTLTNNGPYDLNMSNAWPNGIPINWNYRFDIRDEAGQPLQKKTLMFITGEPQTMFVQPGERSSSEEGLSYIYDMRTPGAYTVQ